MPQSHTLGSHVVPVLVQQSRGHLTDLLLAILSVHHNGVVLVIAIDPGFASAVLTNSDLDTTSSDPGQNFQEFI